MHILVIILKLVILFLLVKSVMGLWASSGHFTAFLGNSVILLLLFCLLVVGLIVGGFVMLNRHNSRYDHLEDAGDSLQEFKEKNKADEL